MAKINLASTSTQSSLDQGLSLLFGGQSPVITPSGDSIRQIPCDQFDDHPQQGRWSMNEDELNWLSNNIAEVGVLNPVQAMLKPDGRYLLLEGHRRKAAAMRAGLTMLPTLVHPYDAARATIIFNATNLGQRQKLRPSEKAFAYVELEQAVGSGGKTTAAIAALTGDNLRAIQRHKRLTELVPELLARVDAGAVPVFAGVELSYLTKEDQQTLAAVFEEKGVKKLTLKQAAALRNAAETEDLTKENVEVLLFSNKKEKTEYPQWLEDQARAFLDCNDIAPQAITVQQLKSKGKCHEGFCNDTVDYDCSPNGITFSRHAVHGYEKLSLTWTAFVRYCREITGADKEIRLSDLSDLLPPSCTQQEEAVQLIRTALKFYNSRPGTPGNPIVY